MISFADIPELSEELSRVNEHMERLCALLKARGIDARVGG